MDPGNSVATPLSRYGPDDKDERDRPRAGEPISPLVGEMAGRPEGGAVPPASPRLQHLQPIC
ncbi:hypothetical protein FJ938_05700 [Mesorhizobium sp. B2-4-14]|nr:hypothetical protein FJ548_07670 [Mesorhizobium sp. B2-4-17]TPL10201.1 hypothetical protein FJ938_05700 [Mesorhizobium sp. B2-4-14]